MAYKIRHIGTSEFVSRIGPALVCFVSGWDNSDAKVWDRLDDAKMAEKKVWEIEGFHTSIEEANDNPCNGGHKCRNI
jgi:hypothetical protein